MKVSDLFEVSYGHSLELNGLERSRGEGAVNFVSRTQKNNMVSARVRILDGVDPTPAGTLSVALGGTVLETALQPEQYYSGRDIAVLAPLVPMADAEKLWWADCIMANRYRYNYGRQANRTLGDLELPDEIPSWVSSAVIPDYSRIKDSASNEAVVLNVSSWKPFRLGDLLYASKIPTSSLSDLASGPVPVVSATATNNGVSCHKKTTSLNPPNSLTVAKNGRPGVTFFQPDAFAATSDVNVLIPNTFSLDSARGAFLATVIEREGFRYNYGRKFNADLMASTVIKLPATIDGEVDWAWIDSFMGSLPYSVGVATSD